MTSAPTSLALYLDHLVAALSMATGSAAPHDAIPDSASRRTIRPGASATRPSTRSSPPHGFDAVGGAGRRHSAPAYGFDTTRRDGARLQLYSVPGQTVIRLSGVPVEPSACDG